jgi:hypothetical protein
VSPEELSAIRDAVNELDSVYWWGTDREIEAALDTVQTLVIDARTSWRPR